MKTVQDIVQEYLVKNKYGGLYYDEPEGCWCVLGENLMHCERKEFDVRKCKPGRTIQCKDMPGFFRVGGK